MGRSYEDKTIQDVIDTMDEDQFKVLIYLLGQALQSNTSQHLVQIFSRRI